MDVLRSSTGVEARAVDFKGCCLRSLDLFLVSCYFELESDVLGLRFAVDCSALESLSTPLVAAAGSVRLRKKKKGKIGISELLRLLGQIQHKLDRVCVGVVSKPNERRKRVCILGLNNYVLGWASGSVFEVGSDHMSDSGLYLDPGHYSVPGQHLDLGLNWFEVGFKSCICLEFFDGFGFRPWAFPSGVLSPSCASSG